MIQEFVKACLLVFVAELGDKSQILVMTFATKYPVRKVLLGACIGALLNHGIAVALGSCLSTFISLEWLRMSAALLFLVYGLWTLVADEGGAEEETRTVLQAAGPVLTVASAYFLSELGDKTQITAIGLAANAKAPLFVLMGTVSGMVLTGSVGILIGSRLGQRIPELGIKLTSSGIFTLFGLMSLYDTVPEQWLSWKVVTAFLVVLGVVYCLLIRWAVRQSRTRQLGRLAIVSGRLYEHLQRTKEAVDAVCLGEKCCGKCEGDTCPVGFAKEILDKSLGYHSRYLETVPPFPTSGGKKFDTDKVAEALAETLRSCEQCGRGHQERCAVHQTRRALELMYFGEPLPFDGDVEAYLRRLAGRDVGLSKKVALQMSA